MQPPSSGAISLSQLAVVPALPPPRHCLPKTLHALISASPWLPRHLEVIIQQRTPKKSHFHNETSHFVSVPCFLLAPHSCLLQSVAYFWPLALSSSVIIWIACHLTFHTLWFNTEAPTILTSESSEASPATIGWEWRPTSSEPEQHTSHPRTLIPCCPMSHSASIFAVVRIWCITDLWYVFFVSDHAHYKQDKADFKQF